MTLTLSINDMIWIAFTVLAIFVMGIVVGHLMTIETAASPDKPAPTPKGKLYCADCERPMHKRDKYRIVVARHIDCSDPKQVGQASFPELKETL